MRWLIYDYCFLRSLPAFSDELRMSFLIVMALLLSPLSWTYYFLFLLVPVVVFFKISQHHALSKTFFVFFILALVLPYFALFSNNKTMWIIQNFSDTASLVCWIVCVFSAAKSVSRANPPLKKNQEILFAILCCHILVNVILIYFDYGMPYFLDLTKKVYVRNTMPAFSIPNNKVGKNGELLDMNGRKKSILNPVF